MNKNITTKKRLLELINQTRLEYILISDLNSIGDIDILIKFNKTEYKTLKKHIENNFFNIVYEKQGLIENIVLGLFDKENNNLLRLDLYSKPVLTSYKTYPYIYYIDYDYFKHKSISVDSIPILNKKLSDIHLVLRKLLKRDFESIEKIRKIPSFNDDELPINMFSAKELNYFLNNFNESSSLILEKKLKRINSFKKISKKTLIKIKVKNLLKFGVNAPHIAFIGSDGCGKSTLIESLTFDINYIYGGSKYIHLRPTLVPASRNIKNSISKKKNNDIPKPHDNKPYSYILSNLKFYSLIFDYCVGYLLILKYRLIGKPVISDRYFYDIIVDPRRFRLNEISNFKKTLIRKILPKPNQTFYLSADPDLIYQRKKDLTLSEITLQKGKYDLLINDFKEIEVINASEPAINVLNETKNILFNK